MSGIVFALLGVAVAVILAGMGSAYGVGVVHRVSTVCWLVSSLFLRLVFLAAALT